MPFSRSGARHRLSSEDFFMKLPELPTVLKMRVVLKTLLKNFKHIESYGESSGFPVYGGKL